MIQTKFAEQNVIHITINQQQQLDEPPSSAWLLSFTMFRCSHRNGSEKHSKFGGNYYLMLINQMTMTMFVHLNKKISIPNCSQVRCIAWSWQHEFIACGGESGMLKVIRLENVNQVVSKNDSSKNFQMNQTLESHKATVESVCWNEKFQKLTSSDANGTIIVWMFYKGMWYEEMVNNRQKSLVTGMAWTHDGNKICIVYEDGAIITGSVDGSRLWGKELKNISLNQVEWSPDGKIILIGTKDLDIHLFDQAGDFLRKISFKTKGAEKFIAIKWFGHSLIRPLIIAFDNGVVQLMKNESDNNAQVIDCEMRITSIQWNYIGDMFAVTGNYGGGTSGSRKNFLKIFNNQGELMSVTKVPGTEIHDCSWEKNSRKLVLAVDSFMYFANLKRRTSWCFLTNSVSFLREDFDGEQNKKQKYLTFWQFGNQTNRRYERLANNFVQMACWHHYCVVVERIDQSNDKREAFSLSLYNSIGTLIDYHLVTADLPIRFCCMNSNRVIVTSNGSAFYIWSFKQLYNENSFKSLYGDHLYQELSMNNDNVVNNAVVGNLIIDRNERITCITVSEKFFVVGFDSGKIHQYLLPNMTRTNEISMEGNGVAWCLALNRNSTKLAITDRNLKFYLYDFEANNEQTWTDGNWIEMTKLNDVWQFEWSSDHNDLIVLMDKNKMIVINLYKGAVKMLDPITSDGYICSFEKLSVQTILLDQLIVGIGSDNYQSDCNQIDINDFIENIASHYVNDIRALINENNSVTDAINYAVKMPELASLWNILGEECLKNLDIETAYLTMIKTHDYKGLQLIKRLNRFKDSQLQKAEISAYQNRLSEAESQYLDLDRPDLAISLNKISGNFERVRTLLEKYNNLANHDKELEQVYMNLGEYYADNHDWQQAIRYYAKINAYNKLAQCYMMVEKYDALVTLVDKVDDQKILLEMAMFFESLAFCKDAVRAYIRAGNFEKAINACVKLNEWKLATELAEQYKTKNIDALLEKYVQHLESDHKYMEMIQVFRKANKIEKAVSIIMKMVDETRKSKDLSLLKKLYVLVGLIHEENKLNNHNSGNKHEKLDELLLQNNDDDDDLTNDRSATIDPWKGAEAYHYYMVAQRNLYLGKYSMAMNCSLHLQDYEEYLTVEEIYSLLALTAYANKCYDICSKAFIKLESLDNQQQQSTSWHSWINDLFNIGGSGETTNISKAENTEIIRKTKKYQQMAVNIFLKNSPDEIRNDVSNKVACKFCGQSSIPPYSTTCPKCQTKFHVCVATGRSMIDQNCKNWTCQRCKHHAMAEEIRSLKNCPLCHCKI